MSSVESDKALSSLRNSISVSVGKGEPVTSDVYLSLHKLKSEGVDILAVEDSLKSYGLYKEYKYYAPKSNLPQNEETIFVQSPNSKFSRVDDSSGKGYRRVDSAIGWIFAEINRKLTQDLVVIAGK